MLGISGSPRRGGNSELLLDSALAGGRAAGAEIDKIRLVDLAIAPIQEVEYDRVGDDGLSVIDDDLRAVCREIQACDSLILASPIFFGSLSGQMKVMIDRFQCVWISRHRLGHAPFPGRRRGALLCVSAAHRTAFFGNARSIVGNFYSLINVEYAEELYCSGVDARGQVKDHPLCLERAFELGRKLASAGPPG